MDIPVIKRALDNNDQSKANQRVLSENKVEELTRNFLMGEISMSDYKNITSEYDCQIDLRQAASDIAA